MPIGFGFDKMKPSPYQEWLRLIASFLYPIGIIRDICSLIGENVEINQLCVVKLHHRGFFPHLPSIYWKIITTSGQ